MRRAVGAGMLAAVLLLTACRGYEVVDNDVALYFDGDRRDIVDECLKRMNSPAEAPIGEPTEVRVIGVTTTVVDDARSTHELTATLTVDGQPHTWTCRVSQRYTMLDVREQSFELVPRG